MMMRNWHFTYNKRNLLFAGLIILLVGLVILLLLSSRDSDEQPFVINELMASNKTGILSADGKTHDWIEIRNISDSKANLSGYTLEGDSGKVEWEFPSIELKAGECIVVYATKKDLKDQLHCDFKLSAKGDTIRLKAPHGKLVSEVGYKKLQDDQALKLTNDSDYKKTYQATPGFKNGDKGRAEWAKAMEKQRTDGLKIWEYQNKSGADIHGRWVELKNTSKKAIDLSAYTLTNDDDKPEKVKLPKQMLQPGQIFVCYDEQRLLKGESVMLMKNKRFVDGVCAAETYMGTSIGRQTGKDGFYYFDTPTIGAENTTTAYAEVAEKPKFDTKPGVYQQQSMNIKLKTHKTTVHYTIDGTRPTLSSPVYKDSIHIDRTTIIRALAVDSAKMTSTMATATFIMGEKHSLPVVSVTMSNADLYDNNTGIYATGPGAAADYPHLGANYWKPWEKQAHIEFFDGKDGFSYDCGIKIFGAYSRARDKKSFQIKFRRCYGESKLKYDLYNTGHEEKVKALVLRAGSQDDIGTMVRDEFFTSLMGKESPTLHVQANRPVVLYVNGQYFGVYFIREKINDEFVGSHLGVDPETVTLLCGPGSPQIGSNTEYKSLLAYVRSHDMKDDAAYKYVCSKMDCASLIDYKLGEYYSGNQDVGNIRFFRSSDKNSDGKWYWLYYDLDWGFYYSTPLRFYIRENEESSAAGSLSAYNVLMNRLLQNPQFRQLFLERWAHHRNVTFSEKNALAVFDGLIEAIRPEMERNCKRWPQMGYKSWERNVTNFRNKIKTRVAAMDADVRNEIAPTAEEKRKYKI